MFVSTTALHQLTWIPYRVAKADVLLEDLYDTLTAAGDQVFACTAAAARVVIARRMLALVVRGVDDAVSDALEIARKVDAEENGESVPF